MTQEAAAGVAVQKTRLERRRVRRDGLKRRGWQDAAVSEAVCNGGASDRLVAALRESRALKISGTAREDAKCCVKAGF